MASLDGMPLSHTNHGHRSGAAFLLAGPAPMTKRITFEGVEAEIATKSRFVIVRGIRGDGLMPIVRTGLAAALRALDLFSIKGVADLTLTHVTDEHITWTADASAPLVSLYSTSVVNAKFSATAAGDGVSMPPERSHWHPSMRFFRQAQVVDDLSESTRNVWLAVENLLDDLTPWQAGEPEGAWLVRALTAAGRRIDFAPYLPGDRPPTASSVYDYFYDETRTHLFHAKGSRHTQLPAEAEGTNYLAHRHDSVTRFYLDLLSASIGVRRDGSGGLTYAGFDAMTENLSTLGMAVSDDSSPLSAEDEVINPAGGIAIGASAKYHPLLSHPGRVVFSARMRREEAAQLSAIRRVGLTESGNTLLTSATVEGRLELSGITGLRAYYALRLNNTGMPRQYPVH